MDDVFVGKSSSFLKYFEHAQMKMVADQKGPDDLKAFLFNEEKTLKFLKLKMEILCKTLKEKSLTHCGASSSNFVKSEKFKEDSDDDGKSPIIYSYSVFPKFFETRHMKQILTVWKGKF
jgi:hypothetical protein